jgi:hypothetical protein
MDEEDHEVDYYNGEYAGVYVTKWPTGTSDLRCVALAYEHDLWPFRRNTYIWSTIHHCTEAVYNRVQWNMFMLGIHAPPRHYSTECYVARFANSAHFHNELLGLIRAFLGPCYSVKKKIY